MTQKTNNDEDFHPAIDASNDPTRNLIMNSLNTGFVEVCQTTIDASIIIRELAETIIDHERKQIQLAFSTLIETIEILNEAMNPTPSTPSTIDLCTPSR
ncbi:unnamed protein product [Rotaria magnacalcarata]|uniref:Uncharacterized protein n=3 Tax=Rotaria TaxID=231623 RepID=A0A815QYR1_9BILA|nr:unnamed protein product [Rotaria magnacalcarata]CAF4405084.1 unnamed protein product [Rotaria magnacalcarata]CAF5082156.1 unnamed protein product [Rotaria magnacalcarata]